MNTLVASAVLRCADEFGVQALFGLAFAVKRRVARAAGQLLRQCALARASM